MSYITQPTNCQVRLSPFSQRLLQYNITESNIYLSKATNALLNPYLMGYYNNDNTDINRLPNPVAFPRSNKKYTDRLDCIIDGLDNEFKLYDNILECTISPGQCIVDQTLLIFPEETKLDIEIDSIAYTTDIARCILSVNFQWLETLYEQPPRLRLMMIDPNDPLTFGPDIWETRIDRLVISYFDINLKDTSKFTNYNPKPAQNYEINYININTVPYEVGPNIIFLISFADYLRRNYVRKKIVYTKPCLIPEGLIENEITFPLIFFNRPTGMLDPIIGLRFDIKYDPKEVHNPKYVPNKQLLSLTKVTDVYVDRDSYGVETGLLRIQVGENNYTPTIIPDIELGNLTFYFNYNAPLGTNVTLSIENVTITYSNATVSNLNFIPRSDPVTKTNLQAPALTYNYQQAQINFGSINLENNQHILFYLNGVLETIDVTDDVINDLTSNSIYHINNQLDLEYDNTIKELKLNALDANITFTNPSIINNIATDKQLRFIAGTSDPSVWEINNNYWYWIPTEYDLISVTYNLTDAQTYLLTDVDLAQLTANIGVWITIPSTVDKILQLQYNIVGVKPTLSVRINPTFASTYTITNLVYTMKNGSGLSSQLPSIKDYHRAQHLYDLSGIVLDPGDYIEYNDTTYNVDETVVLTEDIINILKTDKYGYKEDNLHIYINSSNMLVLEPLVYDSKFNKSLVYDFYIDELKPDNTQRPCLWFKNSFISTRPVGTVTFVEDPDKTYATCWKQGDLNWLTAGERDFYSIIDISDLNDTELVHVQVTQDNFIITPQAVEVLLKQHQIRIWMPESFVFKDPIPQLTVYILG